MNEQQQVAQAVIDRGYMKGWSWHQFAARQVYKLAEELGELNQYVRSNQDMDWEVIGEAAVVARTLFDNQMIWGGSKVENLDQAKKELADVQVVVFVLAHCLEQMSGREWSVVKEAVGKATKDVERGVR